MNNKIREKNKCSIFFLKKDTIINGEKIILIIDYIHIKSRDNIDFFNNEIKNKKIINLSPNQEKNVIITDDTIYFSAYGTQTLMSR